MSEAAVELVDVAKSHGDVRAVDGVSLRVDRGAIVGLIGPDGAGKTTTLRMACGLLRPDAGRITALGREVGGRELKRYLGYMPQRFSLYGDLTVAENLRFFAELFGVTGQERKEREARLLDFAQLGSFRRRRAAALSGGMKQKLALACTLIHRPQVLVLDEPTTGVDPVSRRDFWRILKDLAGEGMALLVSTPYMDEADLCDRVALMAAGRIIAEGGPAEVTARFDHELLELSGPDLAEARRRLLAVGTLRVHRFGDRLHVVVLERDADAELRRRVEDLRVRVGPAEPSIEDTFVELMHREGVS
jgi:ABC-2 type transport system ATP-binding protein